MREDENGFYFPNRSASSVNYHSSIKNSLIALKSSYYNAIELDTSFALSLKNETFENNLRNYRNHEQIISLL